MDFYFDISKVDCIWIHSRGKHVCHNSYFFILFLIVTSRGEKSFLKFMNKAYLESHCYLTNQTGRHNRCRPLYISGKTQTYASSVKLTPLNFKQVYFV